MTERVKARVASAMLVGLMAVAWFTMAADRVRMVVLIILGLFLFRIVIHAARSRYDE